MFSLLFVEFQAHGGFTSRSVETSRASPEAPVSDSTPGDNHCHNMRRSDLPLVLYCGANPKVEDVSYVCSSREIALFMAFPSNAPLNFSYGQ